MDDNIKNLRDALEWLDRRIREEAELDGEMTNEHAIQLGFITNMLEKFPPRQCDVGTAEEQGDRFMEYCNARKDKPGKCRNCVFNESVNICAIEWAQTPYAEEGGASHA